MKAEIERGRPREGKKEKERSSGHEIRSCCCIIMACGPSQRAPCSVGSFQYSITWLYQAAAVLNQQYQSTTSQRSIVVFFFALRHPFFSSRIFKRLFQVHSLCLHPILRFSLHVKPPTWLYFLLLWGRNQEASKCISIYKECYTHSTELVVVLLRLEASLLLASPHSCTQFLSHTNNTRCHRGISSALHLQPPSSFSSFFFNLLTSPPPSHRWCKAFFLMPAIPDCIPVNRTTVTAYTSAWRFYCPACCLSLITAPRLQHATERMREQRCSSFLSASAVQYFRITVGGIMIPLSSE